MRARGVLPMVAALTLMCGAQAFADPIMCRRGERVVVRSAYVGRDCPPRVRYGYPYGAYRSRVQYYEPVRYYRPVRYSTRVRYYEPVRYYGRRHRSWGTSALVIGGSAATGAGIGGIVHGGKGALIGGAIGGGLGSLYESGRHR